MGIQIMIELQVKALVEKFNMSPLIIGLVDSTWLRFVASTRIFADEWADEAIQESKSQTQGEAVEFEGPARHSGEPHNILGKRAVMIWYRSVRKTIPLPYSLVISFLVCLLAREAVLPTDVVKWALEGKLPYFAAFVEIEKQMGPPDACRFSSSHMFRPNQPFKSQKLESLAASIALAIGLELPSVNFYALASRFLRQLSVPVEIILPYACLIYEWAMPPELWLSANELRRPTRGCVISILIIAIRILYNLNGFREWEASLSSSSGLSLSNNQRGQGRKSAIDSDMDDDTGQERKAGPTNKCDGQQSELDVAALILGLEAKYDELAVAYEYSKDLPTYLQYRKDVFFSGLEPSVEDHEEEKIINDLWDFYQKKEDATPTEAHATGYTGHGTGVHKRSNADDLSIPKKAKKIQGSGSTCSNSLDEGTQDDELHDSMSSKNSSHTDHSTFSTHQSLVASKEERVRQLRSNMEENRFHYIKPREVNRRKRDDGAFAYAAHAEYYILLRACARVVELDDRSLHGAVMNFEKRLEWVEEKLDRCLDLLPSIDHVCKFCIQQDDPLGFSNLKFAIYYSG